MANITENLNKLIQTKSDIKDAIISKGVRVSDSDTFASYADKIRSIEGGGGTSGDVLDFSRIGYSYPPSYLKEALDYAIEYYNTHQDGYEADHNLQFMPKIEGQYPGQLYLSDAYPSLIIFPDIDLNQSNHQWRDFAYMQSLHINNEKFTTYSYLFSNNQSLQDLQVVNCTHNLTTQKADYMFKGCSLLSSINLLDFEALQSGKITTIASMFSSCETLKTLTGYINCEQAASMNNIFYYCKSIEELDLSNWNVKKVTTLSNIFNTCSNLTTLNLSGWDTSNCSNMSSLCTNCSSLQTINLSGWDFSKMTSTIDLFSGCQQLTTIIGPVSGIKYNISLSAATALSVDSIMVFINGLEEVSGRTLTLGATNLAKLSEEQKKIATDKGWTLK